jgi:hypothetical protein
VAAFQEEDRLANRLDLQLLQSSPIMMYRRREVLDADIEWLMEHDYRANDLDCAGWLSGDDLQEAIAAQLEFPDYYGRNLDTLDDCLSELPIPENGGRLLILRAFDQFASRCPDIAWYVLDIIAANSRYHLLFGRRLITLLHSDDPQLTIEAVGACPVMWNPKEFRDEDRAV